MQSYGKRAKMREARAAALAEIDTCVEHFDLVLLMTLHDEAPHFGAKRLRRFYRAFTAKYDEYKRRYLAGDDKTVCGNRTDTYALKKHLKEIGFDYDKECEEILRELEQK